MRENKLSFPAEFKPTNMKRTQEIDSIITNRLETEIFDSKQAVLLFGKVISPYTKSPAIWNGVFKEFNINAHYQAVDIPDARGVHALFDILTQDSTFLGNNVGSPYKETVHDEILRRGGKVVGAAERTKSVNTVVHRDGELTGYSTDGPGEIGNLRNAMPDFKDKRVLLLGAKGGAIAVADALLEEGALEIVVANRTALNAEKLQAQLDPYYPGKIHIIGEDDVSDASATGAFDLVLNASLKGQASKPEEQFSSLANTSGTLEQNLEVSAAALAKMQSANPNLVVADLIYNPVMSPLLKQAHELGLTTVNGKGMLTAQAALAFELIMAGKTDVSYNDIIGIMESEFDKATAA